MNFIFEQNPFLTEWKPTYSSKQVWYWQIYRPAATLDYYKSGNDIRQFQWSLSLVAAILKYKQ